MILKSCVCLPSSWSLRACSSIDPRPAYASRQPRRPHVHWAPPRRTTMWPISPAEPRPSQRLPLRIRPPPTPVPQNTPSRSRYGSPAPSSNSASVATSTSLPTATGAPSAFLSVAATGNGDVPVRDVAHVRDGARLRDRSRPGSRRRRRPGSDGRHAGSRRAASRSAPTISSATACRAALDRGRGAGLASYLVIGADDRPPGSSSRRDRFRHAAVSGAPCSRTLPPHPLGSARAGPGPASSRPARGSPPSHARGVLHAPGRRDASACRVPRPPRRGGARPRRAHHRDRVQRHAARLSPMQRGRARAATAVPSPSNTRPVRATTSASACTPSRTRCCRRLDSATPRTAPTATRRSGPASAASRSCTRAASPASAT